MTFVFVRSDGPLKVSMKAETGPEEDHTQLESNLYTGGGTPYVCDYCM